MTVKDFFLSMINFTSGCTEPAAIALNASHASAALYDGEKIEDIHLQIDYLTYKNAYNAGIPNTLTHKGTIWSFLFGWIIRRPELELEVFKLLNEKGIEQAEKLAETINLKISFNERSSLFIRSFVKTDQRIIATQTMDIHNSVSRKIFDRTGFRTDQLEGIITEIENGEKMEHETALSGNDYFNIEYYEPGRWVTIVDELYADKDVRTMIGEGIGSNLNAENVGKLEWDTSSKDLGVGSAIYARMSGKPIKVLACGKSGNKGLTSIVSTVNYCRDKGYDEEKTIKSVILACFVNSIITIRFGFISSICGVVYGAGAGFLASLLYLDNKLDDYHKAFLNYISRFGGIFCDGAKVSCAVKGNTAVQAALDSRDMIGKNLTVDYHDGYLGKTFYKTLENLLLYNDALKQMDRITVSILKNKKQAL